MNAPCSGAICIMLTPPSSAVVWIRPCCTVSGGVPCATRYSWISDPRKKDLGSAMDRPYWLQRISSRSGARADEESGRVRVAAERLGREHLERSACRRGPREARRLRERALGQRGAAVRVTEHEVERGHQLLGTVGEDAGHAVGHRVGVTGDAGGDRRGSA